MNPEIGQIYKTKIEIEFFDLPYFGPPSEDDSTFICEIKENQIVLLLEMTKVTSDVSSFDMNYKLLYDGKIGWYTKSNHNTFNNIFRTVLTEID